VFQETLRSNNEIKIDSKDSVYLIEIQTMLIDLKFLTLFSRLIYKWSEVAEMDNRLATIGVGRKWGGAAVAAGSPLGSHLT